VGKTSIDRLRSLPALEALAALWSLAHRRARLVKSTMPAIARALSVPAFLVTTVPYLTKEYQKKCKFV
jgi:hypothetical protein